MIATFISQCEKKALARTRKVLDAFANRIGDNVWQTVITQDGLEAVKKSLRATATKNTAVACHLGSRFSSKLAWIVGNRNKFNRHGSVPVNTTKRKLNYLQIEDGWADTTMIQIFATLAALLHDIGKSTLGFQNKLKQTLKSTKPTPDPFRHEWISLRLFQAMIAGCKTDEEWLTRFVKFNEYIKAQTDWQQLKPPIYNDSTQERKHPENASIKNLPFGKFVAWLIVTHHRLPYNPEISHDYFDTLKYDCLYECIKTPFVGWVKSVNSKKINGSNNSDQDFWEFKQLVTNSLSWQAKLQRWAKKALYYIRQLHNKAHNTESNTASNVEIDAFTLYISRLCLMVGDHNYSSLTAKNTKGGKKDHATNDTLYANTCLLKEANSGKETVKRVLNQKLDEHLIGVAEHTAKFAKWLPQLLRELPKASCKTFDMPATGEHYKWQNESYKLAKTMQQLSEQIGFFGINMASTGRGKTLTNARIMYALAGSKGARFTIALGLRVLTIQTATMLRAKLHLAAENNGDILTALIGNNAPYIQNGTQTNTSTSNGNAHNNDASSNNDETSNDVYGSESLEELVSEDVFSYDSNNAFIDDMCTTLLDVNIKSDKAKKLLYTPIVSCTIDHIIAASENIKGGKHIVPILRLLSSDLILDEPDDFSLNDLPALSRLVHLAGLFGSKVMLSSATLTPDLVRGLFEAYQAGRAIWLKHYNPCEGNTHGNTILCGWFDEYQQKRFSCKTTDEFYEEHKKFVETRASNIRKTAIRQRGDILCMNSITKNNGLHEELAELLVKHAVVLHSNHHEKINHSGKLTTASIGLIRFAHIKDLIEVAKLMVEKQSAFNIDQAHNTKTSIYICCYHSKQLLCLRNALERRLDQVLNRQNGATLAEKEEGIMEFINKSDAPNNIFIVLASPVAEVGRDHDYDWAIVEPSSMRSIIQLAGRVRRHRLENLNNDKPNIMLMDLNIEGIKEIKDTNGSNANQARSKLIFTKPGFEMKLITHNRNERQSIVLKGYKMCELLKNIEYETINAIPRIMQTENGDTMQSFSALEHYVMAQLFNPSHIKTTSHEYEIISSWYEPKKFYIASGILQRLLPFRKPDSKYNEYIYTFNSAEQEYNFKYKDADTSVNTTNYQFSAWDWPENNNSHNGNITINPWYTHEPKEIIKITLLDLAKCLGYSYDDMTEDEQNQLLEKLSRQYSVVRLRELSAELSATYCFHPYLGFWVVQS